MADTRIRTRGVFFKNVEGTYRENDVKINVSARERIFREPLFEVEIEGAKIKGKKGEVEGAIGAKLNPKVVAIEKVNAFLSEVALEVGLYTPFKVPSQEVPQIPEPEMRPPTAAKSHLTVEEIVTEIRENSSFYAVMTVKRGHRTQAWGREVVSAGCFSIVEGTINPKFPFEQGTVEDNNQFADQGPLSRHNSNGKNEMIVVRAKQQSVEQTKIYLFAGNYLDQFGRNSTAIFVFNATPEIVDSMRKMGTENKRDELKQIVDQTLTIASEKFPETYTKTNSEQSRGRVKLYIYS